MNNGKICVSICAETADEMFEKIQSAKKSADVIEVRFDCLDPAEVQTAIENLPKIEKTYLFTFRPKDQGGKREIQLGERLKFWEIVFHHHKAGFMIDIEGEPSLMLAIDPNGIRRIVSLHDFHGAPEGLEGVFDFFTGTGAIAKLAVTANDSIDSISVWNLLSKATTANKNVIPIAMGEAGKWTRILGLAHGAFLTYAAPEAGSETAPGQVSVSDLIELYRVRQLNRETKVFGIVGDPVSQSLSTYMHNPAFASSGVNAVFIPFLVKDIGGFMTRIVRAETREIELNFGGFAVTMPHKQSIMKHLDSIDPVAKAIGAVNTVKIGEDGKLTGYNTDAHGFITPLKDYFGDLSGRRVAVFGAGGAARACVFALLQEKAEVAVFARDPNKAETLANDFGIPFASISEFKSQNTQSADAYEIAVDTTPVGMSGQFEDKSLFSAEDLKGVKFVYDLVTKLYDTPIIRVAKEAGISAISGMEMLIEQGAMQFEIWTGQTAPREKMRESMLERFERIKK